MKRRNKDYVFSVSLGFYDNTDTFVITDYFISSKRSIITKLDLKTLIKSVAIEENKHPKSFTIINIRNLF